MQVLNLHPSITSGMTEMLSTVLPSQELLLSLAENVAKNAFSEGLLLLSQDRQFAEACV